MHLYLKVVVRTCMHVCVCLYGCVGRYAYSEFACVYENRWMRGWETETTQRARETVSPSLCTCLTQTPRAFLCCIRHISSFWSTSSETSSGKWRTWICLSGTRWDCVIIVGSWSFFFFSWDSECNNIGVSILAAGSWTQTSRITFGKQDDVCYDYSVSQKSAPQS